MSDFHYQLIKYLGGVVAALYGVFATFTDFHERKHGKKVLSKAGRYGLAILAISSIWSLSSDVLKDHLEQKEKEELAKVQAAELDNTEKALDTFNYDLSLGFYIEIPMQQPPVRAFLARFSTLQFARNLPPDMNHIEIPEKDDTFPNPESYEEYPLAMVTSFDTGNVFISKKGSHINDLTMIAVCTNNWFPDSPTDAVGDLGKTLSFYRRKPEESGAGDFLLLTCGTSKISYRARGTFRSNLDLAGASFKITFSAHDRHLSSEKHQPRLVEYDLTLFWLNLPPRRANGSVQIASIMKKRCSDPGNEDVYGKPIEYPCFEGTIPDTFAH